MTGPLNAGRRAAERLMVDICTVRAKTGVVTDDGTGDVTPVYAVHYDGKCKVQTQSGGAMGQQVVAGDVVEVVLRTQLHLPVLGSELVDRDDEVLITASASDPALVGRTFRIRDDNHKSLSTARRLGIEEIT